MPQRRFSAEPTVDVGGRTFSESAGPRIVEIVVDLDATAPGSCTIVLIDDTRTALQGVEPGTPVSVAAPAIDGDELVDLFRGEVYALEFEADERGTYARIVAYDPLYRLKQHRVSTVYASMTDSDIVREIADLLGVPLAGVEQTSEVHEHLGQFNETHWEFLQGRARAIGFELIADRGELRFRRPPPSSEGPEPESHTAANPLHLTSGSNLIQVRIRTTAAEQVAEVEVRGWDPNRKQELVSTVAAGTVTSELAQSGPALAELAGSPKRVAARSNASVQASCDASAAALGDQAASTFVYVEGVALGDPRLRAGEAVALAETGSFDGRYTLSRTRHVFRPGDYRTWFWVSGGHDRTTFSISRAADAPSRWVGCHPAIVTNLKDPLGAHRVKLQFPWLDERYESDWARVVQPGAGQQEGISWFPEVGDEVLVAFTGGDPRAPVVVGSLHNNQDRPPFADYLDGGKGTVEIRGLQSRAGHRLVFHDRAGQEQLELSTGDGSCIVRLDQQGTTVMVESGGELTLKATGDLGIEAGGACRITAGKTLALEGATVEIKGQPIELN